MKNAAFPDIAGARHEGSKGQALAQKKHRANGGFTLIEMVAAMVIAGILVAVSVPMLSNGFRAYEASRASLATISKLRYATERMAREIREVRRNAPTTYDISAPSPIAAGNSITFTKQDGVTVTIAQAGPTVTLTYSAPIATAILTDQLSSLQFNYFQADGVTAANTTANVAFVQITLSLTQGTATYSQRTRVGLRNQI